MGDRSRQGRLIEGGTQDEVIARLASLGVNLSKAALSKFERNQCNPTVSVLMNLASVLNVSASYFVQEPQVGVTWVAFRKTTRLTAAQEERIQAFAKDRAEKQAWLQMKLYPDEDIYFPRPISVQTERDAERAAEYLRQQWNLGEDSIESVAQIFEDHGGVLIFWETDQGEFDGLLGWVNERSEEHTSELQSPDHLVCRLLLEKKKTNKQRKARTQRINRYARVQNEQYVRGDEGIREVSTIIRGR